MSNTTVDSTKYGTIITAVGLAKFADGILNGTRVSVVSAAVGDGGGSYYVPTLDQTALKNECWRGEIAYARLNESSDNVIDVKFVVPADVGGFTIREAALIDADGDTIAICNTPDAEKVPTIDGVSFPITMVMHIIVKDASVVAFAINPSLDTVSREEMENAIGAHNSDPNAHGGLGGARIVEITIPADGWTLDEHGERYIDIPVPEADESRYPDVALHKSSIETAREAELCPTVQSLEGAVRFWAKKQPTADMNATLALIISGSGDGGGNASGGGAYVLPIATSTTLGGIKLGTGLKSSADGTVSVASGVSDEDIATSDDTESMLDEIFAD